MYANRDIGSRRSRRYDVRMQPLVSNYDVLMVVVVAASFQIACVVAGGVAIVRMLRESQRLTKVVAGLLIQEEEKTRALFRQS